MTEGSLKTVSHSQISLVADKIKEKFNPQKVILFGSYASGKANKDSDVDILVIMNTQLKSYKQAALIRLTLDESFGVLFPMDIIVRSPEEFSKLPQEQNAFINGIIFTGISL